MQHNVSKVHPCCGVHRNFIPFSLCVYYILLFIHTSMDVRIISNFLVNINNVAMDLVYKYLFKSLLSFFGIYT